MKTYLYLSAFFVFCVAAGACISPPSESIEDAPGVDIAAQGPTPCDPGSDNNICYGRTLEGKFVHVIEGRCYAEGCCTGCVSRDGCRSGLESAACGASGSECAACVVGTCENGACLTR